MAEDKNYFFPVIAIVAIVAIVGLVVLFMQNKGGAIYAGTTPNYAATTTQAMSSEQFTVTKEGERTKVVAEGISDESNSIGMAASKSTCCIYEGRIWQYCDGGCGAGSLGWAYTMAWEANCATQTGPGEMTGRYIC
jgi:hypothetical protein